MTKSRANRLSFALLLLLYRQHGRFPDGFPKIDPNVVDQVAQQIGMAGTPNNGIHLAARTWKRHRAEIRAVFGYREATVADAEALEDWLRGQAAEVGAVVDHLTVRLEARCREMLIEPPSADRVDRIVRAAIRAHEEHLYADIQARLPLMARTRLDALLQPASIEKGGLDGADPLGAAPALLMRLRGDPGRASLAGVQAEMAKLELVRGIELPADLFAHVLPHELERYRQRVSVEAPHELRRHSEPARLTWLAAFAHLRSRQLTDNLVDLLIETVHHINLATKIIGESSCHGVRFGSSNLLSFLPG